MKIETYHRHENGRQETVYFLVVGDGRAFRLDDAAIEAIEQAQLTRNTPKPSKAPAKARPPKRAPKRAPKT